MIRERKELAVGATEAEAINQLNESKHAPYDFARHQMDFDPATELYSIYHRRKPTDRTIKRPITRESRAPYPNGSSRDRRPVVVTLHPRELIETRLKGTRRRYSITWDDLHAYLVRRHALAVLRAKQMERAARRKARKAAKR